jgi:hypothetical protein
MDSEQITRRLIETHRLRVGPNMAEHCLSRLQQPDTRVITLIGGDALTGVPRTVNVDPSQLTPATTTNPQTPPSRPT